MEYFETKDRDAKYYTTMVKKGTAADKISALSMLIQKNTARSLHYLQEIVAVASKKNRKQAEYAYTALRDLFTKHLLQDGV